MSTQHDTDGHVIEREKTDYKKPPLFHVVMHNDDYTPMPFVTGILTDVFNKNLETAVQIMLDVHRKGHGIAGTYTREIAETKSEIAMARARKADHPFKLTVEPA
ncbi:MAG TPA: ATP-dependent Clp protease adaptor ClpS [Micavibrio sp.]